MLIRPSFIKSGILLSRELNITGLIMTMVALERMTLEEKEKELYKKA